MTTETMLEIVNHQPVEHASPILREEIVFDPAFREACERNACGYYNRCYTCPPFIGEIEELIAQAQQYSHGVLFQTVGRLRDSYDIENMTAAAANHNLLCQNIREELERQYSGKYLLLGAGTCQLCKKCGARTGEPCRFPERVIAPMEAYGIFVSETARHVGMDYINGQNTVTYFGLVLF